MPHMYGYDVDEFTDAYNEFVKWTKDTRTTLTLAELITHLHSLPETDHFLLEACAREYADEFEMEI